MQLKRFLIQNSLKWVIIVSLLTVVDANPDAKRLYDDLLSNYNRLIRPVSNNTDTVLVKLGLRLSQLIDLVSVMSQCLVNASKISPMAPSTLLQWHWNPFRAFQQKQNHNESCLGPNKKGDHAETLLLSSSIYFSSMLGSIWQLGTF